MAHHKAALKSIRQDKKRTARNRFFKVTMRTHIKKFIRLLMDKKVDEARQALPGLFSVIDRSVTKTVLHRNAAARYKARLSKRFNDLAAEVAAQ